MKKLKKSKEWQLKKIIPGGICFSKDQILFYQTIGHPIIKKPKDVMFGIFIIINISICFLVQEQIY